MQFVPNTHRKQSLVVNGYIFTKGKDNKRDYLIRIAAKGASGELQRD